MGNLKHNIIGLCGYAGVGKDMLAKHMVDNYGFIKLAFADSLKEKLRELCLEFGADIDNPEHKKIIRPLLVAYGESARAFDPSFWIRQLEYRIQSIHGDGAKYVISDVRYVNEAEWVKSKGGVVHIIRRAVQPWEYVGPANITEERTIREIRNRGPALMAFTNYGDRAESLKRWDAYLKGL